ncbi:phosphatase inhibitor-domain-containing protein [Lyophyllum atratum]|nr:phosphatase inhibitor-domain-containing protein [Lyophyllum atratum]
MQRAPITSAPGDGSRTITIIDAAPRPEDAASSSQTELRAIGTLRLRAAPRNEHRVAWDDDVVDNEDCGRKSSKICCIYHKPRKFDESSSEEDSDSDSDSSCDNHRHRRRHPHPHPHPHPEGAAGPASPMRSDQPAPAGVVHQLEEESDRNAYETVPSSKKGKRKAAS